MALMDPVRTFQTVTVPPASPAARSHSLTDELEPATSLVCLNARQSTVFLPFERLGSEAQCSPDHTLSWPLASAAATRLPSAEMATAVTLPGKALTSRTP